MSHHGHGPVRFLLALTIIALLWTLTLSVRVDAQRQGSKTPPTPKPLAVASIPTKLGTFVGISSHDTKQAILAFRDDDGGVHLVTMRNGSISMPAGYLLHVTRSTE